MIRVHVFVDAWLANSAASLSFCEFWKNSPTADNFLLLTSLPSELRAPHDRFKQDREPVLVLFESRFHLLQ